MSVGLAVSLTPPDSWSHVAVQPFQSAGFAEAMTSMGYRPLYLTDGLRGALALVRGAVPGLARLTARANVFVDDAPPEFACEVIQALQHRGIPAVKIGDTMSGVSWDEARGSWPFARTRFVRRHTFLIDLERSDNALLDAMTGAERKIRKSTREGVTVRPVENSEDLAAYCRLSKETSTRVRASTAYTDYPDAFFRILHSRLAPGGVARLYVAWHGEQPLAAAVFLCSRDTMLYYLGGSTRDRELTAKQAPAALFWHAIRQARSLGLKHFDFGGCTPTDAAEDPRRGVYAFKKSWGGRLEVFHNIEVTLSSSAVYLQERVLSPLWDRVHPLYFKLTQLRQ